MFNLAPIKFNQLVWHDQAYLHPVQRINVGPDFYDRTAEKTALKAHLQSQTYTPLIILGERRSGKTSLLKLLDNYLVSDSTGRFISVCNIWTGFKSCRDLIQEIWQEVQIQLRKTPLQNHPSIGIRPTTTAELLEAFRNLPFADKQKVVIAIDELDSYINEAGEIAPAEAPLFEALIQQLAGASDLPLQLLLSATCLPANLTGKPPFSPPAVLVRLHPFNRMDLTEMVKGVIDSTSVPLSDDDLGCLFEFSGGWPWWAKLLILCLNETEPGGTRVNQAALLAVKHPNVGPVIENVYFYHFDKAEKTLVLTLIKRGGCLSVDQIPAMPLTQQMALARLVERDYVQQNPAGDYTFKIRLLADWFLTWNRFDEEMGLYLS